MRPPIGKALSDNTFQGFIGAHIVGVAELHAVIHAEIKLCQVAGKVLFRHDLVRPDQPALENREEPFRRVRMSEEDDDAVVMDNRARLVAQSTLHPFVQGLIDALPEPGTNWTVEGRAKWLQAAANNFDLMYKGGGTIHVSAKGTTHAEAKNEGAD